MPCHLFLGYKTAFSFIYFILITKIQSKDRGERKRENNGRDQRTLVFGLYVGMLEI